MKTEAQEKFDREVCAGHGKRIEALVRDHEMLLKLLRDDILERLNKIDEQHQALTTRLDKLDSALVRWGMP